MRHAGRKSLAEGGSGATAPGADQLDSAFIDLTSVDGARKRLVFSVLITHSAITIARGRHDVEIVLIEAVPSKSATECIRLTYGRRWAASCMFLLFTRRRVGLPEPGGYMTASHFS